MGAQDIVGILDRSNVTNPGSRSRIQISHTRAREALRELTSIEGLAHSMEEMNRLRNMFYAQLVDITKNTFGVSIFCSARDECQGRAEIEEQLDEMMEYWQSAGVGLVTTGYGPFLMEKPIHAANRAGIDTLGIPLSSLQGEHNHRSKDPLAHPKQILASSYIDDRCSCFDAVSDATLIFTGGIGTAREFVDLLQKVQLQRDNGAKVKHPFLHRWLNGRNLLTPILLYGPMNNRYLELLHGMVEMKTISPGDMDLVRTFNNLWEVTEFIELRVKQWRDAAPEVVH